MVHKKIQGKYYSTTITRVKTSLVVHITLTNSYNCTVYLAKFIVNHKTNIKDLDI